MSDETIVSTLMQQYADNKSRGGSGGGGRMWPCVAVNGPCGQRLWACRRWPVSKADANVWTERQLERRRKHADAWKGSFVSECATHAGFMDYLRANPALPTPIVWVDDDAENVL